MLRFDESLWNDLLRQMADAGMNLVVIDLGDGVRYDSHPEIAVENAWTPERLRGELRRCGRWAWSRSRSSTSRPPTTPGSADSRMVSTPRYYAVCQT